MAIQESISDEQKRQCDEWQAAGEQLRAAVAYRCFRGQAGVLAAVGGISESALLRFVETGEISDLDRSVLETLS